LVQDEKWRPAGEWRGGKSGRAMASVRNGAAPGIVTGADRDGRNGGGREWRRAGIVGDGDGVS
jgi:hypothetical protein